MPNVNVHFIDSGYSPTGLGEPGVAPFPAALCNAIFAASGKRHRDLPIKPMAI
jgi:isoquinoline 1-oxidoreductase beta subunit